MTWIAAPLLMLAQTSAEAHAAPPAEDADASSSLDEDLRRVGELYEQGQSHFDLSRFAEAAAAWSEAFRLLPPGEEYAGMRATLRYNIASAEVEAFDLDGDPQRLRRALKLLERYRAHLEDEEARAEVDRRLAAIEDHLEAIERADKAARRRRDAPLNPQPLAPPTTPVSTPARPLIVGGSFSLVVGAGLLGTMGWALWRGGDVEAQGAAAAESSYDQLREAGYLANDLAIGTGVVGGVLVGAGVAMVVAGTRLRARDGDEARARPRWRDLRVEVGPRGGSLAWRGHF